MPAVSGLGTYGTLDYDDAVCAEGTSDEGYIVVGNTWAMYMDETDVIVMKLTWNGGMIDWMYKHSWNGPSYAGSVKQTSDGGYIVAGWISRLQRDALVMKLNPNGSIGWQKAYSGLGSEAAKSIQQTSDGCSSYKGQHQIVNLRDSTGLSSYGGHHS
jgi:hypothetical protein